MSLNSKIETEKRKQENQGRKSGKAEERHNKEAFFSKAYCPLASSTSQLVLFHHHFRGEGPLLCPLLGGPLPCPLLEGGSSSVSTSGGSSSMSTFGVVVLFPCTLLGRFLFHVHFWGSHVTYPIMLLYTAVEFPSASWAKFKWDPPRVEQTD